MQRTLLAILLVHRGEVVSVDRLVDDLWASAPPRRGSEDAAGVRVTAARRARSRLRSRTRPAAMRSDCRLVRVDVDRFERLYDEGRELDAGVTAAPRARRFGRRSRSGAVAPLTELADNTRAAAEIARLEELRLAALEERVERDLELGRHAALVPELERLVREQPSAGAAARAAHARALPKRTPGGRARGLPGGTPALRDELGLEPGPGAAGARARDPQPGAGAAGTAACGPVAASKAQRRGGALRGRPAGCSSSRPRSRRLLIAHEQRTDGRDSPQRRRTRSSRSTRARTRSWPSFRSAPRPLPSRSARSRPGSRTRATRRSRASIR